MIKSLTVETFDENIEPVPLAAVMFHRCHCEPSAEMLPAYNQYSETRDDMAFFLLERKQGQPLFERFNIDGYPTVIFYRAGQRIGQYDGWSTYDHMVAALDSVK
jgi:hypothetical protein